MVEYAFGLDSTTGGYPHWSRWGTDVCVKRAKMSKRLGCPGSPRFERHGFITLVKEKSACYSMHLGRHKEYWECYARRLHVPSLALDCLPLGYFHSLSCSNNALFVSTYHLLRLMLNCQKPFLNTPPSGLSLRNAGDTRPCAFVRSKHTHGQT